MGNNITDFSNSATSLAKSPLGIIALFIVLVYGFASLVVTLPNNLSASEREPLIYFMVFFPCVVLISFLWLVSKHPDKIYSPSDFKDEKNFLKMKEDLAELEKKSEIEYALQIVELRADLEDLRQKTHKSVITEISSPKEIIKNFDDSAFLEAVGRYNHNGKNEHGWRARIAVDKQLITGWGRLPISQFKELLNKPDNSLAMEMEMAIAVSLGSPLQGETDIEVSELLIELLNSIWERPRYRAAQTIERLASRADTTEESINILSKAIELRLNIESADVVKKELQKSASALSSALYKHSF